MRLSALILLATVVASPALAQTAEPDRPTIVVEGRGRAERSPDTFFVGGQLRAEGTDQVSALRAIAEAQARLTTGLTDMDGLTASRLLTNNFAVSPIYRDDCSEVRRENEACPVAAYAATMRFMFKASPASEAGNAVTLASELGATNVGTSTVEVDDVSVLRTEANRLAFADARRQAEALADASGQTISGILRVQDSNANWPDQDSGKVEEIVVTGSRIRPSVAIPLDQPPVAIEARLTVVFAVTRGR